MPSKYCVYLWNDLVLRFKRFEGNIYNILSEHYSFINCLVCLKWRSPRNLAMTIYLIPTLFVGVIPCGFSTLTSIPGPWSLNVPLFYTFSPLFNTALHNSGMVNHYIHDNCEFIWCCALRDRLICKTADTDGGSKCNLEHKF